MRSTTRTTIKIRTYESTVVRRSYPADVSHVRAEPPDDDIGLIGNGLSDPSDESAGKDIVVSEIKGESK